MTDDELVAHVEDLAVGVEPQDRWALLSKTSPSGKAMFVCLSCGLVTPAPQPECLTYEDHTTRVLVAQKVQVAGGGPWRKCSEWKPHPEEPRQHARR